MTKLFDNTRIKEARECLRKHYFRHGKHWRGTGFEPALVFGSSWHCAMDVVWSVLSDPKNHKLNTQTVAEAALVAFNDNWVENGGPRMEDIGPDELYSLEPRTPMIALEMLYEYVDKRRPLLTDPKFKLIAVEKPFAVPLDPEDENLFYVGRLDKVFEYGKYIYIGEHKTTTLYSKSSTFRSTFLGSFSPDSQIDGYLHAGHMLYGDRLKEVWVDAALVHKTVHDGFKIIPVERQFAQLDAWLWETRYWIGRIEANWEAHDRQKDAWIARGAGEDDKYMASFPRDTNSCFNYNRPCPYLDLCIGWPNPMLRELPAGYVEDKWDPFDRLKLETIGMKR